MERLINNKKYLTFILIGMLTLVIGISLSFIMFDLSGSDNSIQTGQVTMTYTEPSNEVLLKDALPKSDESGKNQSEYFEFSVMSNITTNEDDDMGYNMPYEISLSKTAIDKMFNILKDEAIKVYLTEVNGEDEYIVVEPILISDLDVSDFDSNSYKVYDAQNRHHNNEGSISTKYRIRFWIDENVDATNWYKENKYEYRFVVNINGYAEKNNELTLSQRIKKLYTPENGAAKIDDGVYYLQGPEVEQDALSIEQELLEGFGTIGSVYLYRNSDSTFNVNLLENHLKDFVINELEVTEEEYKQITDPFGGYLNAIIGMQSGIIDGDMQYVDGKTIDDIPSLEEIMDNEDIRAEFCEMIGSMISEMYAIDSKYFLDAYYKSEKFNKILLDENLELGLTNVYNMTELAQQLKLNFGSVSDGFIAQLYDLVEYDQNNVPQLIEGKKIPTLEEIYITGVKKEVTYITNNYIELNNTLYEIISINKDNTLNLINTNEIFCYPYNNVDIFNNNCSDILGIKKSDIYEELIKDTTLKEIIVLENNKYNIVDDSKEHIRDEYLEGYVRLLSKEELLNTFNGYSFLSGYISTNQLIDGKAFVQYQLNESSKETSIYSTSTNLVTEVITIKDIYVSGDGTKDSPYVIESEKIIAPEQIARYYKYNNQDTGNASSYIKYSYSIQNNLKYLNVIDKTKSYYAMGSGKQYYSDRYLNASYFDINAVGIKIDDSCYYVYYNNELVKQNPVNGDCPLGEPPIIKKHPQYKTTYSYNETIFTVEVENAENYKWQYKKGDEWIDFEELTGRIEGVNTSTLILHPDSYFNEETSLRCVISNKLGYVISNNAVMNMILTDGEWIYTEIEDTNKFKIIEHVQTDMSNSYSLTPNGKTGLEGYPMYDLVVPSTINGDIITGIDSVGGDYWYELPQLQYQLFGMPAYLTKVTFEEGIETIGASVTSWSGLFEWGSIQEVVLPTTIKTIGGYSFAHNKLSKLNLEDAKNLTIIGNMAFPAAQLENVVIPASVQQIGWGAFDSSNIKELTFEGAENGTSKLEFIGEDAFDYNQLEEVIIPASVREIYGRGFSNNNITKIEIVDTITNPSQLNNIYYSAFERNGPIKKITLPKSLEIIGSSAFESLGIEELEIKGVKNGTSLLKRISYDAFRDNELKSFVGPSSLEWIGEDAFRDNKISDLDLKEGIEILHARAFYSNEIEEVDLPSSLKDVKSEVFQENPIKDDILFIYDGVLTYLKVGTNNVNKKIVIPEGVKIIRNDSAASQEINELILSDTVETVESFVFNEAKINKLKLSKNLKNIEQYAFANNNIKVLEMPSSVKIIGNKAFAYNAITSLSLNEGLETIGEDAFNRALLTELTIPSSVKTLASNCFYQSPLTKLTLKDGITAIGESAFYSAKLEELEIPGSVVSVGDSAFYNSLLKTLKLNVGTQNIQIRAFYNAQITELLLPNTITNIGTEAFYNAKLEELEIPGSVKTIDWGAFKNSVLTKLTLNEGLEYIGSAAFKNAEITELKLPSTLNGIGSSAFYNAKLTELEIPANVTYIDYDAFYNSPLTKLVLHEGIEKLYNRAFYNAKLIELKLPSSLQKIETDTFHNSRFTDLKVYGKTSINGLSIIMEDGYEPEFISGALE